MKAPAELPRSLVDILVRTGFAASYAALPEQVASFLGSCRITRYAVGSPFDDALAEALRGDAPFVMFLDDAVTIPVDLLVDTFETLGANPDCAGVTLGCAALPAMFGPGVLPPWFAVVRRSIIPRAREVAWTTPEFFLIDLAARVGGRATFETVGSPRSLRLDARSWIRDRLAKEPLGLAGDFARFRAARPGAERLVPPQFQVDAVGRFVAPSPLGPSALRSGDYPTFSIICPVFKPDFLAAMIGSVTRQTWPNWELVMIVDGPAESSQARIEAILDEHAHDPRIRFTFQPNAGTGPTRNALAESAREDFIISIDDDDELAPDCLATFAAAIVENPGVPFFRGGARLVGIVTREMPPRPRLVIAGITSDIFEVTQPFAIAADVLRAMGGLDWDPSLRNAGEDTLLFMKIDRLRLETCIIDRPLYHRRLSSSNLTLQFEADECMHHGRTIDRWSRPPEWTVTGSHSESEGDFVRSSTAYVRADGREVVTTTRYFQYRAFGTLSGTTLDLEITSACNAVCTFCPRDVMPDKTKLIPLAVVERLAGELASLKDKPLVAFCGIGESTLHPELEKITRLIAGTGCLVSMTTNGARMTAPLFHALVAAGMCVFNFSVNATTAATHRTIMKLPSFERIVATIHELLAIRDREYPSVRIHVSLVVCVENEDEAEPFVEYWRDTSVTRVWLHPVNNRAGLLSGLVRPVSLKRFAAHFARDPRVTVDVLNDRAEGPDLCKVAKTMNFVSADGEVRLCAMDYRRQTHYGNLATESLLASHHAKLQAFVRGDTRSICETCDFFPASCRRTVANSSPQPVVA